MSQFHGNLFKRMFKSVNNRFSIVRRALLGPFSGLFEIRRKFVYSSDTRGRVVYLLGLLDSTVVTSGNEPTIETSKIIIYSPSSEWISDIQYLVLVG